MSASSVVIALDHAHGFSGLSYSFKCVKSRSEREHLCKTSVLGNDRTPGGEVARGTITKPAAAKTNIHVLGDREFAAGTSQVITIAPWIGRDGHGIKDVPAIVRQDCAIAGNLLDVHRQLESACGFGGKIQETEPFGPFAPCKDLALVL